MLDVLYCVDITIQFYDLPELPAALRLCFNASKTGELLILSGLRRSRFVTTTSGDVWSGSSPREVLSQVSPEIGTSSQRNSSLSLSGGVTTPRRLQPRSDVGATSRLRRRPARCASLSRRTAPVCVGSDVVLKHEAFSDEDFDGERLCDVANNRCGDDAVCDITGCDGACSSGFKLVV